MDRLNRLLWIFIGVMLMIVGALGIAAGSGHLHGVDPHTALLPRWLLDQWHAWGVWPLVVLSVAGLVMCWLGWLLLRAELRARGHRTTPAEIVLESGHDEAPGTTSVRGHAITHAAERDLQRHPAIEQARVGLTGDPAHPEMHARIDVTADTDLQVIDEHVTRTLQQLTTTSSLCPRHVQITVRPGRGTEPRVY
jgi:hypothetical protein